MKHLLPITSALLLVGGLSAQTVSGKTATDFGNEVKAGTASDSDSEKKDTMIGARGLGASSVIRGSAYASSFASVRKSTSRYTGRTTVSGAVSDRASLSSRSSSNKSSANTTGDSGKAGAHSVSFEMKADKDTKGTLTIYVSASASTGGAATASVKVGDKTYAVKAGDRPMRVTMDFTLTSMGVMATAETSGSVSLDGSGRKGYGASASISFTSADSSSDPKCEIKDGVKGCGPTLAGTASSSRFGHSVTLNLKGAAKSSIGILLWSSDGKTMDISGCPLFMSPMAPQAFTTDDMGEKTHRLRLPNRDLKFSLQDVILSFDSMGISFKSSNTLDITCTK